jgi:hypothetical protein
VHLLLHRMLCRGEPAAEALAHVKGYDRAFECFTFAP